MMRPNGLARAAIRFKPASFAGTFFALLMSALIVSACGILLETGLRASVPPARYANAPVVVAADQYEYIVTGSGEDAEREAVPLPDTARLDAGLAARAATAPGATAAVADYTFPVHTRGASLTGHGWGSHLLTGTTLTAGAEPRDGEVVLARDAAAVGDTVTFETASGRRDFRVSGIADTGGPLAWFADDQAATLAGHPGRADAIAVLAPPGTDATALAASVTATLAGSEVQVHAGDDRGAVEDPGLGYAKEILFGIGGSFGGIATIVAIFTAAATVALSVSQRARGFALLRAVGATPRQIRRAVAAEALLIAPLAGIAGLLPGLGLAHWWFGQLQDRGAVPAAARLHLSATPLLIAVAVGLLTALAAGWMAGRRPARTRPGQALTDASMQRLRPGGLRTVLGVAALLGGIGLTGIAARSAGNDAAGAALGVVMLFMLAVGLLGPLLARLCAGLFGLPLRGGGPAAGLAAANSRTNTRRLASAFTPIVLAMAFASTLVFMHTSENHAAGKQLRAGLTADHVVTNPAGLAVDAVDGAARTPGVEAVVAVLTTQALVPVGTGEFTSLQGATVQGVTGSGAELAKVQDLDVRDGSLDALGGDRIAIDTTLATAAGRGVGDRLALYLPDGTEISPEIIAVYGRGLGLGTVTMDRASLAGHVTSEFDNALLVRGGPAEPLEALGTVTDADGYATRRSLDAELGAWTNNAMAAVLGGFAAIAAVNTLVMTVLDRRRELGMLRLVGSTRRQVLAMLHWESLLVSLAGVVLGSAIAAATLIPMMRGTTGEAPHIPLLTYGCFAAAATGLALLAVTLPARALLRRRS
ncbi:FtsX-like permease family protein [Paractinoplanes atraurantiacus]|uniref:Putative ABC transport system permease protein n=1 Tax=Paractinoplanes atraurantiacus TaxID=1036182 RepID=A0A285J148_9ACTN|nr:ABC transporter permease [Actinoplanes atraurantiacus]SNY53617.1 putative ABC transport system permease protein [Actinoplanes atraurantiacus]